MLAKVYVAAPMAHVSIAERFARQIERYAEGLKVVSTWHSRPPEQTPESLLRDAEVKRIAAENLKDVVSADILVALGFVGGAETIVEVGRSLQLGRRVVWLQLGAKIPLSVRAEGHVVPQGCDNVRQIFDRALITIACVRDELQSTDASGAERT